MASDNGWITPVHETMFDTQAGTTMVRIVVRRKTGLMRIYIKHPDGSRLGLSVDEKHILAARGTRHEVIRKQLDQAEVTVAQPALPQPTP
jgi:hypothetical protein